jgi:hypothetical protein
MAVISAGGLAALIAWTQARVTDKGDLLIPRDDAAHLKDFKAYVGKCPEVDEWTITDMPGSTHALAKLVLKPGHRLPSIAPRI